MDAEGKCCTQYLMNTILDQSMNKHNFILKSDKNNYHGPKRHPPLPIFNRPGVAGAVLQSPLSID